ncbi:hypothetical protein Tco_1484537 [Tanacetum coccineum]
MEQQHMNEQMDKERERQNKEERKWEERNDYFNHSNWTQDESMDVDAYNRKKFMFILMLVNSRICHQMIHHKSNTSTKVPSMVMADLSASAQDIHEGDADVSVARTQTRRTKPVRPGKNKRKKGRKLDSGNQVGQRFRESFQEERAAIRGIVPKEKEEEQRFRELFPKEGRPIDSGNQSREN